MTLAEAVLLSEVLDQYVPTPAEAQDCCNRLNQICATHAFVVTVMEDQRWFIVPVGLAPTAGRTYYAPERPKPREGGR